MPMNNSFDPNMGPGLPSPSIDAAPPQAVQQPSVPSRGVGEKKVCTFWLAGNCQQFMTCPDRHPPEYECQILRAEMGFSEQGRQNGNNNLGGNSFVGNNFGDNNFVGNTFAGNNFAGSSIGGNSIGGNNFVGTSPSGGNPGGGSFIGDGFSPGNFGGNNSVANSGAWGSNPW